MTPPSRFSLAPGHVDIWSVDVEACRDPALLGAYAALLSPAERQRNERFVFERDRRADLATRALVRTVLGRCLGRPPASLVFEAGPHGKPALAEAGDAAALPRFNLTHCRSKVLLAVSPDLELGIDVEDCSGPAPIDVAEHQFAADETRSLRALPPCDQAERFWSLWTLKESLIKADGQGLHQALSSFGFSLDSPGGIALHVFDAKDRARLDRPWWFGLWRPAPSHMAALCIETVGGDRPVLRWHEAVPLLHERPAGVSMIRTSA